MNKVILIAFPQASLMGDIVEMFQNSGKDVEILDPYLFLEQGSNVSIPHMVFVTLDFDLRRQVIDKFDQDGHARFTYVHPTADVSANAVIGAGCFIAPFVKIFSQTTLESDCIIGPYSMVSHKCFIGQGTMCHPGTMIAGTTSIGKYCKLNMRSTVIDHLTVCDYSEIGAGAMLTKNVDIPGVYIGTPARRVKTGCMADVNETN